MLQYDFGAVSIERSDRYSWTVDVYPARRAKLQLINKVSF
jgi:hypothetical protein